MPNSNNKAFKSGKVLSEKRNSKQVPPSVYEDEIPLEDLREEEIEIRKKDQTKNTSSTQKKEPDRK
ncbi:hypothetical protein [Bacillus piscicola]|uniref:hypothetical protein n=1 Tax=Bacillus piscicola TaxID=1632684 RepID=UPI001F09B29D|nr:hypothetical protein [Bacillus piscicola]